MKPGASFHEPPEQLSELTRNLHRALLSLVEEFEAVDWYHQRAEVASDSELAAVLRHHRDEEIEHAMMLLEWIRRRDAAFAHNAERYLFTNQPLLEIETEFERSTSPRATADSSLGIGALRPRDKGTEE